jgi:replicative DNA helicase
MRAREEPPWPDEEAAWLPNEPAGQGGQRDRPLPHDLETEGALIGAALLDPDAASEAATLPADAWYKQANATIASAISDLLDLGEPVEANTVHARLAGKGELDQVGGHQALIDAMAMCGASGSARFYADTLRDRLRRRQFISAATLAVEAAYSGPIEVAAGHLETGLDVVGSDSRPLKIDDLLDDHLTLLEKRHAGEVVTVPTGLVDLDLKLGGLRLGELTVAAGRPGMGKTVFGGGLALSVASTGRRSLFASLEMSTPELLDRWLGGEARIDTTDLQQGRLDAQGWGRISENIGRIGSWPIWILDRPEASVPMIRAAARAVRAEFVVVDYLGLIRPTGRHSNRQEEVASVARSLKAMARVLDCPVLCLAQLNRGVEARQEKRPLLSDLRESGEVEQSAGIVLSLYREDYYDPETADRGLIEIGILKNRHGPLGTVKAAFLGRIQRIANVAGINAHGRVA